jgi:glycolate oxidase iron-sulfur subunit
MQTALAEQIRHTPAGQRAETILRSCVHCGFCTATCPTYQLLGDELDGPRGRIYQIKQLLEGATATPTLRRHLDRCLTCRACETTCPSGVRYAELLEIGRSMVEQQTPRPPSERLTRKLLVAVLSKPRRFGPLLRLGQLLRPLLPAGIQPKIPPRRDACAPASAWPPGRHGRRMLVLDGCVQPAAAPDINAAAARLLDRLGISLQRVPQAGCCGALPLHLSDAARARQMARNNIDAWLPRLDAGAEAILVTASGCGVQVKEYGHLLADDPDYAAKALRVAAAARDPVEVLESEAMPAISRSGKGPRIAFQSPCTLQHGQQLAGRVETLLTRLGYRLTPVPDAHLCCGSAGTYALLQPELSSQLRAHKRNALLSGRPQAIASANIGCLLQLQGDDDIPVLHWLQLLERDLAGAAAQVAVSPD